MHVAISMNVGGSCSDREKMSMQAFTLYDLNRTATFTLNPNLTSLKVRNSYHTIRQVGVPAISMRLGARIEVETDGGERVTWHVAAHECRQCLGRSWELCTRRPETDETPPFL